MPLLTRMCVCVRACVCVCVCVQGEEGEEPTGPEPLKFVITETQRLRFMMQSISAGTDVVRPQLGSSNISDPPPIGRPLSSLSPEIDRSRAAPPGSQSPMVLAEI
jgi:hypothetical protein